MSMHDVLFQLGASTAALRNSQTEEQQEKQLAKQQQAQPTIPMGRQHAPQHPSLSFIHDRSLRYGS